MVIIINMRAKTCNPAENQGIAIIVYRGGRIQAMSLGSAPR
jgi:hypothetical protein